MKINGMQIQITLYYKVNPLFFDVGAMTPPKSVLTIFQVEVNRTNIEVASEHYGQEMNI